MGKLKLTEEEKEKKRQDEISHKQKYDSLLAEYTMRHKIYNRSSERMYGLSDASIDLIVTSPPYFNAKAYSSYADLNGYYLEMKAIFTECFRVLKPGRRFCLNISDLPVKGDSGIKWISLGAGLLKICEEIGFELSDRVIWLKTPIKGFQYGSLPYPPSPLICDSIEYIYMLRKPNNGKKPDYSKIDPIFKEASKLSREEYGLYTQQIWTMGRVRLKNNIDGHIAPFPEELPRRCIKLYSFVGDTVLDPFGGSGTTGIAAMKSKRNSVQYEIDEKYCNMMYENMLDTKDLFNKDVITKE